MKSQKRSIALHLILITLLGLIAYSNTFDVPFQWDEEVFIENPIVKDLTHFLAPSEIKDHEMHFALKGRYVGYLTFALNYKMHGLDVAGYHGVNILIHILNALLVYLLVVLTFKTPHMKESSLKGFTKYVAFLSSLLFVAHPVQTEAVTYIFQRLASLMAFFYMLSLVTYISSRLSENKTTRYGYYAVSLISAVLAMKTKENAFTLPIAIVLYEFIFFMGSIKHRTLRFIPFLLTLFIIPLTLVGINKPAGEIIIGMGSAPRSYEGISRLDYLFTQFRVIGTYIRLLFFPVNQNIDYDYPVFHSFANPQVLLSFLFLISLVSLSMNLLFRTRRTELHLSAFGLLWFFLALSVESSIIPIPMVINEYRVYLPSAGFFIALSTAIFLLLNRRQKIRAPAFAGLALVILIFSGATYARNNVWESRIRLWEDMVMKSPGKARGHDNLGVAYWNEGLIDKAIEHYLISLKLEPDNAVAYNNLGIVYRDKGLTDNAIASYETAIGLNPDYAEVYNNLGVAYESKGLFDTAIEHLQVALRLDPDDDKTHLNLGIAYSSKGLTDKAIAHYEIALRLNPDYEKAHFNLGVSYLEKGLVDKARMEFEKALQINPVSRNARRFLEHTANPDTILSH